MACPEVPGYSSGIIMVRVELNEQAVCYVHKYHFYRVTNAAAVRFEIGISLRKYHHFGTRPLFGCAERDGSNTPDLFIH